MRLVVVVVVVVALAVAGYFWLVLSWSYSTGERAGWIQKLSKKGWICKTWEGELAMVSMPGATPEKFYFTVRDEAVANRINQVMGKRVSLHYEEKVGLPSSCFGETRHFVTRVTEVQDIPLAPGIHVPTPSPTPGPESGPAEGLTTCRARRDPHDRGVARPTCARGRCVRAAAAAGAPGGRDAGQGVRPLCRRDGVDLPRGARRRAPGGARASGIWESRRATRSCPGCPTGPTRSASGSGSTTWARSTCRSISRTAAGSWRTWWTTPTRG